MKANVVLLGLFSLTLGACEKKQETAQLPKAKSTELKPFAPTRRPSSRPEPREPDHTPPAVIQQAEPAEAVEPPTAATGDPVPATPATAGGAKTTEQLTAERRARMAAANAERTARITTQMQERLQTQDANGDGLLSKDEVGGPMQRRFAEADKNGDGFLDATEQQSMIQGVAQRFGERGEGRNNGGRRGPGGQGGRNRGGQ